MSSPLHPLFVHLPLGLAVIMPLLAGGLLLSWWRGWLPRKAWWVVVALQAALLVGGVAALRTGDAEEHTVELVVDEDFIERHEESGEEFVWAAGLVLALALAAGIAPKESAARLVALGAGVGTIIVLGLAIRTGQEGGALVYEHNAAQAYVSTGSTELTGTALRPARRHDDDDDDDDHDHDD